MAFQTPKAKRSPHLQATNGTVEASTANTSDYCLLQPRQTSGHLHGVFGDYEEKIPEKDEIQKIKALAQRLASVGITHFEEADIEYVLNTGYANGDARKAYSLLVLLEEAEEGIIREYDPNVKMLGAINRHAVSCYLDATLFAMFARLDSFEAMLYKTFDDEPRRKLAILLRLWVNSLRSGELITTDITRQLQEGLALCGWKEAAERHQQDASEAFTFITGKLELPLLTLKMDIFHTGKEDDKDDHKYVNERLLEVAIPEKLDDHSVITLEDCLETYFNSRIEVKRYLERRMTTSSMRSRTSIDSSKANALHIESNEVNGDDLLPSTPTSNAPHSPLPPYSPSRPGAGRDRTPSIIQEHYHSEKSDMCDTCSSPGGQRSDRRRAGSLRKEVLMPAWQFFSLIPWYTDNVPSSDAQVAAHFSSKRPVLGICLKRYSMSPNGQPRRRNTVVDIPLEIGLPHFIHDDNTFGDGHGFGNFKLSLQSVVCHRGDRVDSGHYVSLIRGLAQDARRANEPAKPPPEDRWLLFDDLGMERITYVDIAKALKEESPYLLFYQVQPIEGDPGNIEGGQQPPSYTSDGQDARVSGPPIRRSDTENSEGETVYVERPSLDGQNDEEPRGRSSMTSDRRLSVAFTDTSFPSPRTDVSAEASKSGMNSLGVSRRNSKTSKHGSRSRAPSQSGENRLSASFTRLAGRLTKEKPASSSELADGVDDTREPPTTSATLPEYSLEPEKGRLKKDRKEKSKNRTSTQHLTKGKKKHEKPDRECLVM